ncbi:HAMP domain-containing protein [Agrobacterium rhizogenes]|nr:HAMP domain-containing protein [Rhizobium rhizogenes]NTJ77485.1 HAMP domain-containing protein [Rhizobium rhizogenes]
MKRLRRASLRKQLFFLAIVLVALVSTIATVSEPFIYGRHDKGLEIGLFAGRVEMVLEQFGRSRTPQEENKALAFAERLGLSVQRAPTDQASMTYQLDMPSNDILFAVRELINDGFLMSLKNAFDGDPEPGKLTIKIDDGRALSFQMPKFPTRVWLAPAVASGILKIVIPLILLAYLGSWLITQPLTRFAAAARHASMDDNSGEPFTAEGASEIRSLAASLNTMQSRIQAMLRDRTVMLRAISHDLRTPLTRLRMRAERSNEPDLRNLMLADITTLAAMIDAALGFLDNTPEQARNIDLSSLLQTIVSDFADTGVDVTYTGPRRLAYICMPQGMTRAVSNLVDNASRYAQRVEVRLEKNSDGGVGIFVSDNGPGLPDALKEKVLEPFFKADTARQTGTKSGGFGLGLSVVLGIVTKAHKGTLGLRDNEPSGLIVEINLPPAKPAPSTKIINADATY